MFWRLLRGGLILACAGYAVSAQSQEPYSAGDYLVEIHVNGSPTDVLADFRIEQTGRTFVPAQYLKEAGLDIIAKGDVEIGPSFPIDFRFDENEQKLYLYKAESSPALGRYQRSAPINLSREIPAAILDYGLSYQNVSGTEGRQESFFGNANIFVTRNKWVFDQRLVVNATDTNTDLIRLQTLFERDFPNSITRLSFGDNFYRAPSWGRRSTFIGIQYGRDFSLRPRENQRPFAQLQTLLKERSEIEVVVNGVTQNVRTVNPGLELISPDLVDGVNLVEVRIRDALGVERVENLNFFSTGSALAKGVHDYSVSVGLPRIFDGLENEYQDYLIGSATSRYGLNNWFTLETGAELSNKVGTLGAGGVFTLSSFGALSLSLSGSESRESGFGTQLRAGFERRTSKGAFQAQASFASSSYSDLANAKGVELPDRQWFVRASRRTKFGNFRLSYTDRRDFILPRRSFLDAGWDHNIKKGVSIFATGFLDFAQDGYGLSVGIRYTHGNYFARSSYERDSKLQRATIRAGRSRVERNDWQWSAFLSEGDGPILMRADASYQSDFGEYFVGAGQIGSTNDFVLGTRGSIIGVGKSIHFNRQLGEAFALVKTPGLPEQTIFKDNRDVGRTNKNGQLLVSNLRPFQPNSISISPDKISLDYTVGNVQIDVVPPRRGVVEALFDIKADTSLSFQVVETGGKTIDLGLTIRLKKAGTSTVVGYNGRAYLNAAEEDDIVQIFGKSLLTEVPVKAVRQNPKVFITTEPN